MEELVGKVVKITVVHHIGGERKGDPTWLYKGRVEKVAGHMLKLVDCKLGHEVMPMQCKPHWFNTSANTFMHIEEIG